MEYKRVDWIKILSDLCLSDVFGHESWFEIGMEQHKTFYYCFIGDCSSDFEDAWNCLFGKTPKKENAKCFVGRHPEYLEGAIFQALAAAFDYLAQLPVYKAEPLERRILVDAWWKLRALEEKEKLKDLFERKGGEIDE